MPLKAAKNPLAWDKPDLHVRFLNGEVWQKTIVKSTADELSNYGAIHFIWDDAENADIRIEFTTETENQSIVGTNSRKISQRVASTNFNFSDEKDPKQIRRIILHEMCHALGMVHTMQHPDRPELDYDNCFLFFVLMNNIDPEWVVTNVFRRFPIVFFEGLPYDRDSIMQYPLPGQLFVDPNEETKDNYELSEGDKKLIGLMYPKPEKK